MLTVTIGPGQIDCTWRCAACTAAGATFSELDILAQAGTHAARCGAADPDRLTVLADGVSALHLQVARLQAPAGTAPVDVAVAEVRGELVRVDAKAGTLLTLAVERGPVRGGCGVLSGGQLRVQLLDARLGVDGLGDQLHAYDCYLRMQ